MKASSLQEWLRPNIANLTPYSSARGEHKADDSIMLDANENPYGNGENRYPDPLQLELKRVISKEKSVPIDKIFLGNGSDEPIDLLIRSFCLPGEEKIVALDPSYGMYEVSAHINDVGIVKIPLTEEFQLEENKLLQAIDSKVKIIFLCSPNNPSGNSLNKTSLINIIENANCLVVVDEAYIDFSKEESLSNVLEEYPNLVILQTLSKAWGLAGARLGMCFGSTELISILNKVKPPYNIPLFSQEKAIIQLTTEREKIKENIDLILAERERLHTNLLQMPTVGKVYPSDSNFLLVKIDNARKIYQDLIKRGCLVRDRSKQLHCEDCLRISIGTVEENDLLLKLMKELIA